MLIVDFQRWKNEIILTAMILTFVSVNLIWFRLDQAPPMWDQSHYLMNSEQLFRTLTEEGWVSFFKAYTTVFGTKAPLITVLPIPLYYLLGNTYESALYINLIFILICSIYLYKLTSRVADEKAALISVFILNTFPLAFAMSREFLVEYGLMTLVVSWMYHIVRLDTDNSRLDALALGIIIGLGMLMKISFVIYIAFPTIFLIALKLARLKRLPENWLHNLLIIGLVGAAIASPWYFRNITSIFEFAFNSGYGDMAKYWGTGDVFTLGAIRAYWNSVINTGISFYYLILIAASVLILILGAIIPQQPLTGRQFESKYFFFMMIWILVPLTLFTFSVNKDYRYSLPYYPALAVLCALAMTKAAVVKPLKYLPFILLIFPAFNYFYMSFAKDAPTYKWGHFVILAPHLAYAHPPITDLWPNVQLLDRIESDSRELGKHQVRVTMLFNCNYLNRLTQGYYAENLRSNIRFDTIEFYSKQSDDEIVHKVSQDTDYILTKSEKLGPDFTNVKNVRVKRILDEGNLPFAYFDNMPLPDGTFLEMYRKVYAETNGAGNGVGEK